MNTKVKRCTCWVYHATDPAHRAMIERQIEVEKGYGKKGNKAVITILKEQLKPCPSMKESGEIVPDSYVVKPGDVFELRDGELVMKKAKKKGET